MQAFQSGDLELLTARLKERAEELRAITQVYPDEPYPTTIRRAMMEVVVSAMHIAADAGGNVEQEMGNISPYQTIFHLTSTPEIIQWVVHICRDLNEKIIQCRIQRENTTNERINHYIYQHLADPQLSLESVSAHVGLTASYLSAFFIQKNQIGFRDFLNTQRVAAAKRYLTDTGIAVSEIAKRCGFTSDSYFITVFKKYTGITPGAFRRSKGNQEDRDDTPAK